MLSEDRNFFGREYTRSFLWRANVMGPTTSIVVSLSESSLFDDEN
jgi:hypothetical protein